MLGKFFQSLSGWLFTLGILLNNLSSISNPFIRGIFTALSLVNSFIAYFAWYAASILLPDLPRPSVKWLGFDSFRQQNVTAALLGMTSILFYVLSLGAPVLAVGGAICVALSNWMWLLSEINLSTNETRESFDAKAHNIYLNYVGLMTAASNITAISLVSALFFPVSAPFITLSGTVLSLLMSANASQYWLTQFDTIERKESNSEIPEVSSSLTQLGATIEPSCQTHKEASYRKPALAVHQCCKANTLQDEIRDDTIEQSFRLK